MTIKLIHSRISENGTIDGEPGDQNRKEVCVTDWIPADWIAAFRAADLRTADRIADAARAGAENDTIGYSQKTRYTLYNAAKAVGFKLKDITKKCNCDCSSFVAVCVIAAGVKVSPDMWTGNLRDTLLGSGAFIEIPPDKKGLARGDIILRSGHVAIVDIEGSAARPETAVQTNVYAAVMDKKVSGTYTPVTAVYMREGNSISYRAMCVVMPGSILYNYGYYSPDIDSPFKHWLYCDYYKDGIKYTGFVCDKYLTKENVKK